MYMYGPFKGIVARKCVISQALLALLAASPGTARGFTVALCWRLGGLWQMPLAAAVQRPSPRTTLPLLPLLSAPRPFALCPLPFALCSAKVFRLWPLANAARGLQPQEIEPLRYYYYCYYTTLAVPPAAVSVVVQQPTTGSGLSTT